MATFRNFDEVPLSQNLIPQHLLDIESGRRTNALPWRGQFSPDFVASMLRLLEPSALVVDPFCGSGTTLMESSLLGVPSFGVEVNPAAFILARIYELAGWESSRRCAVLETVVEDLTPAAMSGDIDLFGERVKAVNEPEARRIAEAIFLLALGNQKKISTLSYERAYRTVRKVIESIAGASGEIEVQLGDSRSIALADGVADLVFTSPPYVNVFNYHQNYRFATEQLGYNVLSVARSELGANRKFRQNRFLTVIQYVMDSALSLIENQRIVKPGGNIVWVVGRESSVRGVPILNSRLIYELAVGVLNLSIEAKLERKFVSRYGATVFEDILVFRNGENRHKPDGELVLQGSRSIACDFLSESLAAVDGEPREEIYEAIAKANRVEPSPISHGSPL